MSTPESRASENLKSYYDLVMQYLDAKYDHHSVEPTHMSEYREQEISYYEALARYIAENGHEPKGGVIPGVPGSI